MLWNILRADWYRFIRSRFARIMLPSFLAVIGLFALMSSGAGTFGIGGQIGEHDGVALIDGYVGFLYANPDQPHFWELMYSATAFTFFVFFAVSITASVITNSDDKNGITKTVVAMGQSQTLLYLAKLVVVIAVTGVLWLLHNLATLLITLNAKNVSLTGAEWGEWLKLVGVMFGILVVLMLVAALVCLLTGSQVASLVVTLGLFIAAVIMNAVVVSGSGNVFLRGLLAINPLWHLNRITRYWAQPQVLDHALLLIGIGIPVLVLASVLFLRRRELA